MADENKGMEEDIEEIDGEVLEDVILEDEEKLNETNEQLKNSLAILQADFINFKNRISKEKSKSILLANENLILKLLPIVDDLERSLEHNKENDEFSEGIKNILENFLEILKKEGLEEIESNNVLFDHNLHQAILMEENSEVESGYIIETFQKGYKLNNKVIRPSMVKVSE